MAEVKENLIQLEVVYSKLNKALDENINRLNIGATAVENYNKKISVIPSEFQKSLVDIKTKTDAVTISSKKLEQQSIKESNARNALNKQREQAIAQLEKENAKLQASENLYNKLQAKLNLLSNEYKNLAARKELGLSLTAKEEQRYTSLQGRIQNYDKTLKAVDATMGKHQRNVGNYAGSFNPLSNSINQLTREMPAFTYSVQTGFMALSNNIPIFTDAISNAVAQNKQLIAQGKPTTSVLSQLASSLFSFQTLLGVGITLLTVYGKEIGEWIANLSGASTALDELNKRQKDFNNSRGQGRKDAVSEIAKLKEYVSVLRDSNLPMLERQIALKQLRSQYPGYFKDLKDEALLNGNIYGALNQLNTALEKRKTLELASEYNVTNKQKFQDLDNERKALIQSIPFLEKQLEINKELAQNDARQFSGLVADAENKLNDAKDRRLKIDEEILKYATYISANDAVINQYKKETILLEYQEDKQREKKKKDLKELADLNIEQADFLAREYELRKKILSNGIEANKAIFDNEKNTLKERLDAYGLYMQLKEQLVKEDYEEQNRLIDQEYKAQTESINEAYSNQIKAINKGVIDGSAKRIQAENEKNKAISALEKKYFFDRQISYEDFEKAQKEIRDQYSKEVELATIERFAKIDRANEAALAKLNALKNRSFDGDTLTKETPLSSFKKYFDGKAKIEEDARVESLNRDLAYNKTKLQNLTLTGKTESEEYKKLISEKGALETQLQEVKDANEEKEKKALQEYKELLSETYKSFANDFADKSGFGKMIDVLTGGLDKFEGDAIATALVVSEAFQEAFNTISQNSEAKYQAEFERLKRQKNISRQFAGENAEAREEIERQYEEKRKQIERKKAQEQKKLAIFNIIIDTAQAVVGALAEQNYVGALLFGAIGAAQIAMVSSQSIPEFWRGTENAPEGWALTQEKGAEVITDKYGKVKTYGNDKGAQMTYLNRGDKVYNAQKSEAYINKELAKNGIMPMRQSIINNNENNGLSKEDFNNGISKLAKSFKSQKSSSNTSVYLNNKKINTDSLRGKGKNV
jgi:DNA repair exonuclease SbcCD ATPase subunit